MAENKNSIFRTKTVEAIQSPEVLDDYLRVTTPGVWIFLAAVTCLLAGVIVWSIFGSIEAKLNVAVVCENENYYCVVPYSSYEKVIKSGNIIVGEETYAINTSALMQNVIGDDTDPRIIIEGEFAKGDYVVYMALADIPEKQGIFSATVITEKIKPISLLLQ